MDNDVVCDVKYYANAFKVNVAKAASRNILQACVARYSKSVALQACLAMFQLTADC